MKGLRSATRDSLHRFVAERRPRWAELEGLVVAGRALTAAEWSALADSYRALCADLARVNALGPGEDLRHYLDALAARAHQRLYAAGTAPRWSLLQVLREEFPRELRRSWRMFALAVALFLGPFGYGMAGAWQSPRFAETVLSSEEIEEMEAAYASSTGRADSAEDAQMAGYYVQHNVGIAFRCFATGIFGGLGSAFFLIYNGLVLGTAFGGLFRAGLGDNLLEFASGHAAWELTGIIVAGTAGLRLGAAVVDTGGSSRWESIRRAAPGVLYLAVGATAMLLAAAAIEGFWSASPLPRTVKAGFALVQLLVVLAWLGVGGRRGPASAPGGGA